MKKLFTALMLTMATTSIMAQEPFAEVEVLTYYGFTNPQFSYNGEKQMYTYSTFSDAPRKFIIYDENFTTQLEFNTLSNYITTIYYEYIGMETLELTQTLFNSDEKYEYMFPVWEGNKGESRKCVAIHIASEDGTILKTITFDSDFKYGDECIYSHIKNLNS